MRCVHGMLSHVQGQYARAESELLRAIGLLGPQSPHRSRALAHLGAVLASSGFLKQAELAFKQARALPSTNVQREELLIQLLEGVWLLARVRSQSELEGAQREVRRRLEAAWAVDFSDELESAVQILRKALRSARHHPRVEAHA